MKISNGSWPAFSLILTLEGAPRSSRLLRQGGKFDFPEAEREQAGGQPSFFEGWDFIDASINDKFGAAPRFMCPRIYVLFKIRATKGDSMTKRFWSCALMTLLSAGVSAGFSLAGLLGIGRNDIFGQYAASRSVALLLTVLIAIGLRSRMAIAFLGIAMTVVQAFDGVIGVLAHDPLKTYGPFAFAVLNALAVGWLMRDQASHPNEPVKS
jgi:hypothetical protein